VQTVAGFPESYGMSVNIVGVHAELIRSFL